MLIDQFTPEQIDQIRRELREIAKASKIGNNEKIQGEIRQIFDSRSYHDQCLFPYRAVTDAIGVIADYTFDNFIYKHNGRTKKQVGWYRAQTIPCTEYEEMQNEILDIIRKHRKQTQFSLKKPE